MIKKRAVCVLGMHRSGTSVIAKGLHTLGVYLGQEEDLVPANNENVEGFWEHSKIVDIHDEILSLQSRKWNTLKPLEEGWDKRDSLTLQKDKLKEIVFEEFQNHEIWGWKDPRTCLLFPIWEEILREMNIELNVIFVIRNPHEVAMSLHKRNGITLQEGYALWLFNNLSALYSSLHSRITFLHYDKYMQDPKACLINVSNELQLSDVNISSLELNSIVSPALRHNLTKDVEFFEDESVPEMVRMVYRFLLGAEKDIRSLNLNANNIASLYNEYKKYSEMFPADLKDDYYISQLFVPKEKEYREVDSITVSSNIFGEYHEVIFPLRSEMISTEQYRLDPINQTAVVEINSITLFDLDSGINIYKWRIDKITKWDNIEIIEMKESMKFISLNNDCKIFLEVHSPNLLKYRNLVIKMNMRVNSLNKDALEIFLKQKEASEILLRDVDSLKSQVISSEVELKNTVDESFRIKNELIKLNEDYSRLIKATETEKNKTEQSMEDFRKEISGLESTVKEKENQLEQTKLNLNRIYNSQGFRFLLKCYKLRDKLLPEKSKRKKILKIMYKLMSKRKELKLIITKANIKKAVYYFKKGNLLTVMSKIEHKVNLQSEEIQKIESKPEKNYFFDMISQSPSKIFKEDTIIDIVIPIYDALDYTRKCIATVLKNTSIPFNLYLLNDKSPDSNVETYLNSLKGYSKNNFLQNLYVIHNEKNMGFVKNVNNGMRLSTNDVVILNTDTEVPPYWLERLVKPMLEDRSIATITPFSNCATICSYPNFCEDNELPQGQSVNESDQYFKKFSTEKVIEIPTGIGFCMAMNRKALNQIGYFDEDAFGKGYGEENDWCMRAKHAGYKNVLVPNLFVYHKHGVSFALQKDKNKQERIMENLKKVEERYPDYTARVHGFIEKDPIKPIRNMIDSAMYADSSVKSKGVLLINFSMGGGSKLYSDLLIEKTKNENRNYTFELYSDIVLIKDLDLKNEYSINVNDINQQIFNKLMDFLNIKLIYINQLLSFPIFKLMELIKNSQIEYIYFIHDYFSVCPSYALINSDGVYCSAETDNATCQACIRKNLVTEPWINMNASSIDIDKWRNEFNSFLLGATKVIAPSRSAGDIVNKYYPELSIEVVEHTIQTPIEFTASTENALLESINVAFIGAIGESKGSNIIYEMIDSIEKDNLPINITVIGVTNKQHEFYESEDKKVVFTGYYDNTQISGLLRKYKISIVIIPALWPETFSYTTSEAILSGYPVMTFDIGAPAERVRRDGSGWIVEERTSKAILDQLQKLQGDRNEIIDKMINIKKIHSTDNQETKKSLIKA
ncbi:glycosyltransferase [Paenibacillus sp. MAEPY2]|uniref:glycosyltransferase n=3 Tax=unclassified Paenibacillus TaxID=185978 RepID=UPI0004141B1E|nr:glycosyltransferase [Paenibacillus sp. MAEPY2]